ncbi:MAG: Uma2 family endonuclease [Thainema sp.]
MDWGTQVGMVVNPETRTVEVYRPGSDTSEILKDGDLLTVPELLPGWTVRVSELWPLVF